MSSKSSTHFFHNVYVQSTGTCAGPMEHQGPLGEYFDVYFDDLYCHQKTFEKGEREMQKVAINSCLQKVKMQVSDIDLMVGGDLTNQITATSYTAGQFDVPYIGVYGACSSSCLSMGVSSMLIESNYYSSILAFVSSHNATAERQYRYPVEYGIQKPETTTFTATGAGAILLSNQPSSIRVEAVTFGKVIDWQQTNVNDMGRAMAPAAYETLKQHFSDTGRDFNSYDLIVTGDLSDYGKAILTKMFAEDQVEVNHYNDCGTMLYDIEKQDVFLGGSGCGCSALVTYGYIMEQLKQNKWKRVLIVATGALMSPITIMQKESVPSIAHAISLEVCE